MSTTQRAPGKTAQKPIFQKPDDADVAEKDPSDASESDTFHVEETATTLDTSDEVPEDEVFEDTEPHDPHAETRAEYARRLEALELDHGDINDRIGALEVVLQSLCDTVLGKGVVPVFPAPEEDVKR